MEQRFLDFVADVMDVEPSSISMGTKYREGSWDSIMMLTLIMEIEAEFDTSIPMEKLADVKTLADLFKYVK